MIGRRRFVEGLAATGLAAQATTRASAMPVLSGGQFDLTIGALPINVTGRRRTATAVNGTVPGPILRFREGDTVTINVRNTLRESSSIHWHGLYLPNAMDGVPGLTFPRHRAGRDLHLPLPDPAGRAPTGITATAAPRSRPASTAR
jgi:FtsP/CotA-like multicopper oxidase with cupredoxin domain